MGKFKWKVNVYYKIKKNVSIGWNLKQKAILVNFVIYKKNDQHKFCTTSNNHNTLIMDKCVLVHFFHFQLIWWMIFQSFYNLKLGGKSKLSLNQDLNLVPLAYLNASALNTEILRHDILTVTHLITQRNFHSNLKQD